MHPLSVAKFGGTSVADYPAMQACAKIIIDDPNTKAVVLSASAGITNLLVALAQGCDTIERYALLKQIIDIEEKILSRLPNNQTVRAQVGEILQKIENLAEAASLACSPALTDELISQGEMISSLIFVHLLQEMGVNAVWVDVREIIATDDNFGKATPNDTQTKLNSDKLLKPLIQAGKLVVTQGFIGREPNGRTTTLGRGGSDYSAALLAEVLGAKDVLIWTDVAGIYTTDPRTVPLAQRIESMSFTEAAEMATFGAKVLHPATLRPAVRSNIPVYVGSSKSPKAGGTWVTQSPCHRPTFRAIALRRDQTLLTLSNLAKHSASLFFGQIFAILDKHKISVDTVSTSEISVALTLDYNTPLSAELLTELSQIACVKVSSGLSLIALVGNDLHHSPNLVQQLFSTVDKFNIRLINYGASSNNLCLLVQSDQAADIVRCLHKKLFEN